MNLALIVAFLIFNIVWFVSTYFCYLSQLNRDPFTSTVPMLFKCIYVCITQIVRPPVLKDFRSESGTATLTFALPKDSRNRFKKDQRGYMHLKDIGKFFRMILFPV